jgi:threonine dehydrogenase-like Zn-dependent dehydrogenase
LTIHAIIGREIFATWDRMLELLAKGLDVEHLVTCELPLEEFEHGMTRFGEGLEGKVILYPDEACQGG